MEDDILNFESVTQYELSTLFSRDLVQHVMRLLHPSWRLELSMKDSENSPFTENVKFQVQRILDIQRKVIVSFYDNEFHKGNFMVERFEIFCQKQFDLFSEGLYSPERFIYLCTIIATHAALAYSDGIKESPSIVISIIQEFLKSLKMTYVCEKLFWDELEQTCVNYKLWHISLEESYRNFERTMFDL